MHFVRIALLAYVGLLAMFAFMQRQLMYPATKANSLEASNFPLLEQTFYAASDVELKTSDDVKIKGWHLQVAATPSDRLILLFHGNGGNRSHRGNWYLIAKSLNADVLTVDYHGYGDSGGSPSERTLLLDAEATWKYAIEELKYQPLQVVIVGESLGGGIGVQLAATLSRNKTPPAGLVLCATFSSMLETASNRFWWLPVRYILLDRYRSDRHIGDVTCPVLQFHGDKDTLVPLSLAQKLHGLAPEMSASGKRKVMHILPGADHNNLLQLHGRTMRDHMAAFIR